MHSLLLALAFLPGLTDPDPLAPAVEEVTPCARFSPENVKSERPLILRKLGEEPPANQYLGMVYAKQGCDLPIKTSDWIGRRHERRR
ncbi:hypothetical protein [Sphingomonas sp. M1-B02]|uniref:hypothetical protein n=1 Tax=Sphingomonas sp. M1-B02 TaxID=3114300 RepID=UPI00223F71CE|nr:hypothetical protein [Sphingomonas sp. S6-11]UZK64832.1 hypothetical protein OKW87_09830 [Sphingomonas sp. S6-11]